MSALACSVCTKPEEFDIRWADRSRVSREEPLGYLAIMQKRLILQLNDKTEDLPVLNRCSPVVSEAVSTGKSYCLCCKKTTYTLNSDIVLTKNDRQRIVGSCAECKRQKSSFIKTA